MDDGMMDKLTAVERKNESGWAQFSGGQPFTLSLSILSTTTAAASRLAILLVILHLQDCSHNIYKEFFAYAKHCNVQFTQWVSIQFVCSILVAAGTRQRGAVWSRTMSSSVNSTAVAESATAKKEANAEPLPFVNDKHGGIIIEMTTLMDPQVFSASLKSALSKWREQGIRGVWIKLPIGLANLIQSAVEEGFWYHHAEETYLMLAYWLPNTTHTLPVNATHRVGVGAFVMNDKREVLAVQEKSGVLRGLGVWKFPTGVVEPGEDINIGAVREVKEETGIDTEFIEVLAFRQSHKAYFEKSDLFFVCIMRPLSFNITKQESEIEDAQWIPVEEFAAQPFVQKHELVKYILEVGLAKVDKEYAGFSPILIKSAFTDKQSLFYMNKRDLDKASGSDNKISPGL